MAADANVAMEVDAEVTTGKRLGDGRWSRPGPAGTIKATSIEARIER
jgi:hypothetical protein